MEVDDIIVEEIDLVERRNVFRIRRAHVPEEEGTHNNVLFIFRGAHKAHKL